MYVAIILGLVLLQFIALFVFGQPLICECGTVKLWSGDIFSSDNSQHLFDWYTFSHILHGLLFYIFFRYLFTKWSFVQIVTAALVLEVAWEILENTPWVINHYRESALAAGYVGDSIINSLSDTFAMLVGCVVAYKRKWWHLVAIFLVFEITTAYIVRDNLTLNIINLTFPSERIEVWQLEK